MSQDSRLIRTLLYGWLIPYEMTTSQVPVGPFCRLMLRFTTFSLTHDPFSPLCSHPHDTRSSASHKVNPRPIFRPKPTFSGDNAVPRFSWNSVCKTLFNIQIAVRQAYQMGLGHVNHSTIVPKVSKTETDIRASTKKVLPLMKTSSLLLNGSISCEPRSLLPASAPNSYSSSPPSAGRLDWGGRDGPRLWRVS